MHARRRELLLLSALAATGLVLVIGLNVGLMARNQVYVWLADAFAHGRLDVSAEAAAREGFVDMVVRDGKAYWPSGALPAVVLLPAILLFGTRYEFQAMVQVVLAVGLAAAAFVLARRSGHDAVNAGWFALAFLFGSVVVGVIGANTPWLLAGSLAALLLLGACVESAGKHRPALMGALTGLAMLSRFTAGLGILYFAVLELVGMRTRAEKCRRLVALLVPFALAALLLAGYNHLRFGAWTDTGLASHALRPGIEATNRAQGSFRIANLPRNAYAYFLQLPELRDGLPVASPYGLSVFLLSPIFLFALAARKRSPSFVAAAAVTVPSLAVFLTYFTTGFLQFGPRYLLDILPFWYVVLLETFRRRSFDARHKALIAASAILNVWLFIVFVAYYTLTNVSITS